MDSPAAQQMQQLEEGRHQRMAAPPATHAHCLAAARPDVFLSLYEQIS